MMPYLLVEFIIILILLVWIMFLQKRLTNIIKLEKKQWTKTESNIVTKKLLIMWIENGIEKERIVNYFYQHGIFRISIYGMTEIGVLLYELLKDTDIVIAGGIDRSRKILNLPFGIFKVNEFHEEVDAVIVTSIYYFSEIYDTLHKKIGDHIPIIGLDEILFDITEKTEDALSNG